MTTQDLIDEVVRRSLMFDHLMEMGMIGPTGKRAMSEASRRHSWIKTKQRELGLSSRELGILKK